MRKKLNSQTALKIALSVFIAFHVFSLAIAPNSQTYLAGRLSFLVYPYVSFLEVASQWGFFAPDPGPPPVFVEYEFIGESGQSLGTEFWPEKKDPFWIRERQNRRIAVARFLIASNDRIEKMMGQYFCRLNSKARSVRMWRIVQTIPSLHDVAEGKRKINDATEINRKFVSQHLCGEGRA